MFNYDGAKPKLPGMDMGANDSNDISDTHLDSNAPFVPNINSMQNTPFPNAQSQIPNQFMKAPSLPQSSQNNPSINNIMPQQHRHIQEKFQQQSMNVPPPMPPPTQPSGMVSRGGPMPPAPQQQMTHQQATQETILVQLHLAVKAGLISPALLNQQLPPQMLVMLQQLLQYQQYLQQLIHNEQRIIQQLKMGIHTPNLVHQRQTLTHIGETTKNIKQKIIQLQKDLAKAGSVLFPNKPASSAVPPPTPIGTNMPTDSENIASNLSSDMANLNVQQQPTSQPQSQSKLSQWKRTDSKDVGQTGADADSIMNMQKAGGNTKPNLNHSLSTPNLQYGDLGLTNLGGDPTWSSTATTNQNWPSAIGTPSAAGDASDSKNNENKESQIPGSGLNLNDSIPEFVPGKPWQGNVKTNMEDDPHITPGSFSRSYSLNIPKDDESLVKSMASDASNWSSGGKMPPQAGGHKSWSGGDMAAPSSFSNEVWGVPLKGNASRPPPGLANKQMQGQWSGAGAVNRQHSWAGTYRIHCLGSRFGDDSMLMQI